MRMTRAKYSMSIEVTCSYSANGRGQRQKKKSPKYPEVPARCPPVTVVLGSTAKPVFSVLFPFSFPISQHPPVLFSCWSRHSTRSDLHLHCPSRFPPVGFLACVLRGDPSRPWTVVGRPLIPPHRATPAILYVSCALSMIMANRCSRYASCTSECSRCCPDLVHYPPARLLPSDPSSDRADHLQNAGGPLLRVYCPLG